MKDRDLEKIAVSLKQAADGKRVMCPSEAFGTRYSLDDAYRVQEEVTQRRIAKGDRLIGRKVGVTTAEAMNKFNISEPLWGSLLSSMEIPAGGVFPAPAGREVLLEVEIACVLGSDLDMPAPSTAEVLRAIDYCALALEIVSLPYYSMPEAACDLVACNIMATGLVIGHRPRPISALNLDRVAAELFINDKSVSDTTLGPSIESPLNSLVWLARTMSKRDSPLQAGQVVITGSLTGMQKVQAGDTARATVEGLGEIAVTFAAD